MSRSSLAVDRMTDEALWERLSARLIELESPWPVTGHERSVWAAEARRIAQELRLRGVQLHFPPTA
jgi:hypothetical protein